MGIAGGSRDNGRWWLRLLISPTPSVPIQAEMRIEMRIYALPWCSVQLQERIRDVEFIMRPLLTAWSMSRPCMSSSGSTSIAPFPMKCVDVPTSPFAYASSRASASSSSAAWRPIGTTTATTTSVPGPWFRHPLIRVRARPALHLVSIAVAVASSTSPMMVVMSVMMMVVAVTVLAVVLVCCLLLRRAGIRV